jgi:hypothetical protein
MGNRNVGYQFSGVVELDKGFFLWKMDGEQRKHT